MVIKYISLWNESKVGQERTVNAVIRNSLASRLKKMQISWIKEGARYNVHLCFHFEKWNCVSHFGIRCDGNFCQRRFAYLLSVIQTPLSNIGKHRRIFHIPRFQYKLYLSSRDFWRMQDVANWKYSVSNIGNEINTNLIMSG